MITFCFASVFGPIVASAYLRLNPKPESDGTNFSVPKVYINVNMEEINLGTVQMIKKKKFYFHPVKSFIRLVFNCFSALTRKQLKDSMLLLQTFERASIASQYSKFRPQSVPVISHAKEW